MKPLPFLALCGLLLAGCAQAPSRPVSGAPEASAAAIAPLPNVELDDELLYEFLLAEIASQRGHKALAAEAGVDIARKTRDPRLAQRAAQLAVESGDMTRAITALQEWLKLDDSALAARRLLASLLLRGGQFDAARSELERLLRDDGAGRGDDFLLIFRLAAGHPERAGALALVRDLVQAWPQVAEAHWTLAQLAQLAGDEALALEEARRARTLRPDWAPAVSLEAQLLRKTAPQQGLEVLRDFLSGHPAQHEIRLQYARALLEQKQFEPSRTEFRRLMADGQGGAELAYAIALISIQMGDAQEAEAQLRRLLDGKERDAAHYYLGQLGESRQDDEGALAHYREVKQGEYRFAARLRVVYLLNKRGDAQGALAELRQVQAGDNPQRVQLALLEAQLLREAQRDAEAYDVLRRALAKLPEQPDLLYETAMMADKTGKPAEFERLIRKLIKLKPDHAHAYNALGYSLLERKVRIAEAMELVEKAHQLAPDDFAIMDSVGWGYYRGGRLDESVAMLRRAFAGNPDPEIASHLGEVLWMRGEREEAKQIWADSLKANPGNPLLQAVMKRFMP